jgi:putative FmdB family regulatory protein
MPIYEYRCKACGDTFEVLQKFNDAPLRECRHCSGELEKLLSRTAFVLKGGGWFADGYSRSKGSSDGESKKDGKDGSKGDGSGTAASCCGPGSCGCKN